MTVHNLWAPWRSQYVGGPREDGCVFCLARDEADRPERLVVAQAPSAFLLLNRFPYAPGHLLAVPRRHVAGMEALSPEEISDLWGLLVRAQGALSRLYHPHGFNVGINLGQAAGAGVAAHLHIHLVPRWEGDTNFMPVMADVRVISQHLDEAREALRRELTAPDGAREG